MARSSPSVEKRPRKNPAKISEQLIAPITQPGSQKLHKVLAQAGVGSRRDMEALIDGGQVLVNGDVAKIGCRVTANDVIKVGRRVIKGASDKRPRIILYHKPEGEIVSHDDPQKRTSVFDNLPTIRGAKWIAVGRLDYNSCGLLIFTTSGELSNRLAHPRFGMEREYAVRILGKLSQEQIQQLTAGISLADGEARFEMLEEDQGGEGKNQWYRAIVKEGRTRVVRRMFAAIELVVTRLMRVRFGIIALPPHLKRGQFIELSKTEVAKILEWVGMPNGENVK